MTIGRNPHVAKAKNAEQKAELAEDDMARARAYREAAHLWDRASDREKPGKMRDAYAANAVRNRACADGGSPGADEPAVDEDGAGDEAEPLDPLSIN